MFSQANLSVSFKRWAKQSWYSRYYSDPFCLSTFSLASNSLGREEKNEPHLYTKSIVSQQSKRKNRTSNIAKWSLAQECVGHLFHSEHPNYTHKLLYISISVIVLIGRYYCSPAHSRNVKIIQYFFKALKNKVAPAELSVTSLGNCRRAEKLTGLFCWQLE